MLWILFNIPILCRKHLFLSIIVKWKRKKAYYKYFQRRYVLYTLYISDRFSNATTYIPSRSHLKFHAQSFSDTRILSPTSRQTISAFSRKISKAVSLGVSRARALAGISINTFFPRRSEIFGEPPRSAHVISNYYAKDSSRAHSHGYALIKENYI